MVFDIRRGQFDGWLHAQQRTFVCARYLGPDTPIVRGAVEAADEKDARRILRGVFGWARLPRGTLIFDQNVLCSISLYRTIYSGKDGLASNLCTV